MTVVTDVGEPIVFDLATLETLKVVEMTVSDPWLNRQVTYAGILLSDLIAAVPHSVSATEVHVVALDSYATVIPLADTGTWPILLATRADGQPMSVAESGPTRIIFPYDDYGDLPSARNMSVWNVATIEIR